MTVKVKNGKVVYSDKPNIKVGQDYDVLGSGGKPATAKELANAKKSSSPVISPTIINSKAATKDLNNIKTNVAEVNQGMQTQAQKTSQAKLAADQAKAEKEKIAKEQKQKDEELKIKRDALSETPEPTDELGDTKAYAQKKLQQAEDESFNAAEKFNTTIQNIQNGTVPLSPGENAQIEGLKQQFQSLISEQKLTNIGAAGTANIRGYQTGSAEYDPTFQQKVIGGIVTAGMNKVADLNIKMASAVAEMTQGFKDNKISAIKTGWDVYSKALDDRREALQKTVDDASQAIKDAQEAKQKAEDDFYERVTKPIQAIVLTAKKYNASPQIIEAMLGASSYEEALSLAGNALEDPKAKFELEAARLDNILTRAQINKINKETSQIGQPTAAERKQQEADEKAALAVIPELQDKVGNINTLINHRGLYGAVGPNALARSSFDFDTFTGVRKDFIAGVEQLVSQDTLDTLLNLKAKGGTLGALSEGEGRMLRSAATKIGTYTLKDKNGNVTGYDASETAFRKELETIKMLTQRALTKAQGTILDDSEKESLNIYFNNEALTPGQFDPANYY